VSETEARRLILTAATAIDPLNLDAPAEFEDEAAKRFQELKAVVRDCVRNPTDLSDVIVPVLTALGWLGAPTLLATAIPIRDQPFDLSDLINTLERLDCELEHKIVSRKELQSEATFIWLRDGHTATVVAEFKDGQAVAIDSVDASKKIIGPVPSRLEVLFVRPVKLDLILGGPQKRRRGWFLRRLSPLRPVFRQVLVLTFFSKILTLAVPLFVMAVYDRIIPSADADALHYILVGAILAVLGGLLLQNKRTQLMAFAGARLGYDTSRAVLTHILGLAAPLIEKGSMSAQIARIRDLEQVRTTISGPLALALLELPFLIIMVFVMGAISGWLAAVPFMAGGVFVGAAVVCNRIIFSRSTESAHAAARRQALILETFDNMRAIRVTGSEASWVERFAAFSRASADGNFAHARVVSAVQALAQLVTNFSALTILSIGIDGVLSGKMSAGELIATTLLGWQILLPLQGVFVSSTRIGQLQGAIRQIDTLMSLKGERASNQIAVPLNDINGSIIFDQVTFRYSPEDRPTLANVSFRAEPREVIAIVGSNGAGKSTILSLAAGLYRPQSGAIRLDGKDLRQFDPAQLRQVIAYAPQSPSLFDGTIAENMRMVNPLATDTELEEVLELAGATHSVFSLPAGLATHIDGRKARSLPSSFLGRLSLARAYSRKAPILLLDEPVGHFDFEAEFAFVEALSRERKRSTVLLVTHRPSHMALADKILILEKGAVRYFGPPDKVIDLITKAYSDVARI
jgi:ATP-binding cassette subfamily C protein LapB